MFVVGEIWKIRLYQTVVLHKILERAEFTNKKHEKPTLQSMCSRCLSNSNSSMYVLKRSIALLWWFWIVLFVFVKTYSLWFTWCDLYHTILLYHYAETKEMIYESVNLKRAVHELKQNSFIIQLFSFRRFRSFIKFICWALNKFSTEVNRKFLQRSVNWFYYRAV